MDVLLRREGGERGNWSRLLLLVTVHLWVRTVHFMSLPLLPDCRAVPRILLTPVDPTYEIFPRTVTMYSITVIHSMTKENLLNGQHMSLSICRLIESLLAVEAFIFAAEKRLRSGYRDE